MSKIQDCTHMAMVFGIVSGFIIVIVSGYAIFNVLTSWAPGGNPADTCFVQSKFYCTEQILVFMLIPSIFYWYGLIQQYDEDILKKRAQLEDLQAENTELFSETIKEMEGMLENQADTNAGLAEKSFDAKKRDFLRFVKAAKKKYENYFTGSKSERKALTDEFRTFVKNFLVVFEEASVDPINNPMKLAGPAGAKIDELENLGDIADWVISTLQVTKVNFISSQMQSDKQFLANSRAEERRMKNRALQGYYGLLVARDVVQENAMLRLVFEEWRVIASQSARVTQAAREAGDHRTVQLMEEGGDAFGRRLSLTEDSQMEDTSWMGCTWFRCSRKKADFHGEVHNGFPFVCYVGCASVILFSRDHAYLCGALFATTGAIILDVVSGIMEGEFQLTTVFLALVIYALIMVLLKFESIDEVMRLEAEVNDLKARAVALEEKHQRMNGFWADVQNLADLWLHRTVPRLEVIKEAHNHLEYAKPEDILTLMRNTNQALAQLENSVGPRQLWLKNGGISDDDKKRFGEVIHGLANQQDLPSVIQGLNQANLMIANSSRRASIDRGLLDVQMLKDIQQDDAPKYILG